MVKPANSEPAPAKRVLIVDDHPVLREGLSSIINGEPDLEVCGAAESAEAALRDVPALHPDLIVVDIGLPGKSGLEFIKEIRATNQKVKLLVVSMYDEALYADRVLRAGGDGYIMKQENPEEIIHAIRDVLCGHLYVSEDVLTRNGDGSIKKSTKSKVRPLDQLTDSELEVLESLGKGKSDEEIADQLHLAIGVIATRSEEIRKKLKLKTLNALVRYAVCWVETGAA